jgi:hypothetical protein
MNNQAQTTGSSDLSALRVAQAELMSGDTSGKVYVRLSPGSVAFLTERSKVEEKVSIQLRQAVLQDSSLLSSKSPNS